MQDKSAQSLSLHTNVGNATQLVHYITRIETRMWNELNERLQQAGAVSMAHYEVLQCIAGIEQCRPADIRATLAVSSGGVTKLLDRLEHLGLVARVANASDRRSSYIEMTDEGREALDQAREVVEQTTQSILAHVSTVHDDSQLNQFMCTLDQLNKVLVTRCWDADHQE